MNIPQIGCGLSVRKMNKLSLKKSIYINNANNEIIHDLTNKKIIIDNRIISILNKVNDSTHSITDILSKTRSADIDCYLSFMLKNKILVPSNSNEETMFYPHRVDIETVRHCNARCVYCPQSINPKAEGIMSLHTFNDVIEKLDKFNTSWIALNHYGEPLCDPFFKKRVELLSSKHRLFLSTNGVMVSEDIIDFLSNMNLHTISFNFPSLEPKQWSALMGLPPQLFSIVKRGIENSIKKLSESAKVNLIVQSALPDQKKRMRIIKEHFSKYGQISVVEGFCRSRAGLLNNLHVHSVNHSGKMYFAGCDRIVGHLHISWEGKCYLCCEDYFQNEILGNLIENDVVSVMRSDTVNQLRAEIYGISPMRSQLICRKCPKLRIVKPIDLYESPTHMINNKIGQHEAFM